MNKKLESDVKIVKTNSVTQSSMAQELQIQ
jgi:hypothetical protein